MRRTGRAVRRGTSLRRSDRTAGDSSPVTQGNGRLRGRPGPAGGTPDQSPSPTEQAARPPAPLPGTGAPRSRWRREEGPAAPAGGALRRAHPRAGARQAPAARPSAPCSPCRQALAQRPSDPGPLPSGPAPRPSGPGPFPSNPRPGHPRTLTPLHPHVTHATEFPGHPEATLHRPRGSNLLPDQEDGKRRGTCVRRGMQVPRRLPGPATSSAAPRGCPGTAAGARRTRPPGPPARAAPRASGARRPPPARGAGPPRPCSASTTWPARPAR